MQSLATDPGNGVWKSTDGGATWTQTLTNVIFPGNGNEREGGECIIFNPTNDLEVWAGSRAQGIWVSEDAGSTWTLITSAPAAIYASMYISPSHPGQVFAGGDGGLWVSTNQGANWTQLNTYSVVYRVTVRELMAPIYYGGQNGSQPIDPKDHLRELEQYRQLRRRGSAFGLQNSIGDDGLPIITVTVLQNGNLVASDNYDFTLISTNEGTNFSPVGGNYSFSYVPGALCLNGPLTRCSAGIPPA